MGAPYYVMTIGGQSNCHAGRYIDPETDVTNSRIFERRQDNGVIQIAEEPLVRVSIPENYDGIGSMMTLARNYVLPNILPPTHDILLVHGGVGGTTFVDNNWNVGDSTYEAWITAVTAAMNTHADNVLCCVQWQHGEGDGAASMSKAAYTNALAAIIEDFRSRVPKAGLAPLLVGGLPPETVAYNANLIGVRDAQVDIAASINRSIYVSSSGLTCYDDPPVHLTAASQRTLAGRYWTALQSIGWRMRATWGA